MSRPKLNAGEAEQGLRLSTGRDSVGLFLQAVIDPLIAVLSLGGIALLYDVPVDAPYRFLMVFVFLTACVVFDPPDLSRSSRQNRLLAQGGNVMVSWLIVIAILLSLGYAAKYSEYFSRRVLFTWFAVTPLLIVGLHAAIRRGLLRFYQAGENTCNAVIVGASNIGTKLAGRIADSPYLGMAIKGFFDDRAAERLGDLQGNSLLGRLQDVGKFASAHRIDRIYIALPMIQQQRIAHLLEDLRDTTASIYFVPDVFMFDLIHARITEVSGIPVVGICETPFYGVNGLVKRAFDVAAAGAGLVVLSPLLLLIALGVKLGSKGTVLFKQRRYGLDGEEIVVYKFRSMTVSEDGDNVPQAKRDDARITPFGAFLRRTSLDELPQLINVLQGSMSLVGPRPHAVAHNEMYRKLINGYMIRHKAKPGITGWAQVNGLRGETNTVDKMRARIEYDLDYLRHWSLSLDVKILLKTLLVLARDRNAY